MKNLSIGMSRAQAIEIMGEPDGASANSQGEELVYRHKEWGEWHRRTYFVSIIDGKVAAFGQKELDSH